MSVLLSVCVSVCKLNITWIIERIFTRWEWLQMIKTIILSDEESYRPELVQYMCNTWAKKGIVLGIYIIAMHMCTYMCVYIFLINISVTSQQIFILFLFLMFKGNFVCTKLKKKTNVRMVYLREPARARAYSPPRTFLIFL